MTSRERAKLRAHMSRHVAEKLANGERLTTAQIRDDMFNLHPGEVDEAGRQLASAALQSMARELLKKASKREEANMQVSLFGNSAVNVQVPRCIAVPSEDDAREMVWTSIADATLSEVRAYIKYLRKGAAADYKKAAVLDAFFSKVVDLAGEDDLDVPIRDLLKGFRAGRAAS